MNLPISQLDFNPKFATIGTQNHNGTLTVGIYDCNYFITMLPIRNCRLNAVE